MVTDLDGHITQNVVYIPFGEVFVEERNGNWNTPYLFNAKELDEETGLYYYGARYLDPAGARWLSVDPMWEKYMGMSPYNYCAENPVKMVDPDGRKTVVSQNEDGTYNVISGSIDDDNGIYCDNKLIGYSATPYSFYDEGLGFVGKIDPQDMSGKDFLNDVIQDKDMSLEYYMEKATGRKPLDFKRTNGSEKVIYDDKKDHRQMINFYRGMPLNLKGPDETLPVYASARDVGNIAAGFMAGSRDIPWLAARFAFDKLQTNQDKEAGKDIIWFFECATTKYAERLGYRIGSECFKLKNLKNLPSYGGLTPSRSIITTKDYSPW